MRLLLLLVLITSAMLFPSLAGAHPLWHHHSFASMSIEQREQYQVRSLRHAKGVVQSWQKLRRRGLASASVPRLVRWHTRQARWLRRELRETRATKRAVARAAAQRAAAQRAAAERARAPAPSTAVDGCLSELIDRESGWDVTATNRSTGAYGLPQALPGSKMSTAGPDWATNAATQIRWMIGYIVGRYHGSSCEALDFQKRNGWY